MKWYTYFCRCEYSPVEKCPWNMLAIDIWRFCIPKHQEQMGSYSCSWGIPQAWQNTVLHVFSPPKSWWIWSNPKEPVIDFGKLRMWSWKQWWWWWWWGSSAQYCCHGWLGACVCVCSGHCPCVLMGQLFTQMELLEKLSDKIKHILPKFLTNPNKQKPCCHFIFLLYSKVCLSACISIWGLK